jgi:hypothetical protein
MVMRMNMMMNMMMKMMVNMAHYTADTANMLSDPVYR